MVTITQPATAVSTTRVSTTQVSTTMTSREFNQDTGRAKKAAANGPVFVTDRGAPTHVLLNIDEYRRLTNTGKSLAELLAFPQGENGEDMTGALDALEQEIEKGRRSRVSSSKRMDELMHDLDEIFK